LRTLGFIALALLQVQGDMPDSSMGSGVLDLVARSGLLSRFVLLILILFSVASWASIARLDSRSAAVFSVRRTCSNVTRSSLASSSLASL